MDYTTGQILTAGNEHQQRNPASLTKLMTGYVVDRAIDSKRISPTDIVTVRFIFNVPERRGSRFRARLESRANC